MAEIWLNIPQAVVLEATGDLKRARGLKERDPQLLVVKAALLLPPLGSVPIEPDASDEEVRLALRKIREKIEPRSSERSYAVSLRRVHAKLIDGVTAKGRRAPNLPLRSSTRQNLFALSLTTSMLLIRGRERQFFTIFWSALESLSTVNRKPLSVANFLPRHANRISVIKTSPRSLKRW